MCGIAGIIRPRATEDEIAAVIQEMLGAISYRGPDDCAAFVGHGFGIGAVRLSIVDLDLGNQPALSTDEMVSIVFNGEIFNYAELKIALTRKGYVFQTNSEIETLLHLYLENGPNMVRQLNGQFAIAIIDRRTDQVLLFRDHTGIRPLFYREHGNDFIFASEVKALHAAVPGGFSLDRRSLRQTMRLWTVAGERTAFENVRQVPPGHYLVRGRGGVKLQRYWNWPVPGTLNPIALKSDTEYCEAFREVLDTAIRRQRMADVEIASYVSGGIDSAVIAHSVAGAATKPLKTFSITFDDPGYDESEAQAAVVASLGSSHTSMQVSRSDIAANFPATIYHAETPLFRTAPVPLFMLSERVNRAGIKVVMTGEGADEVLLGYDLFRETKIRRFWARNPDSKFRAQLFRRLYHYLPQYKNPRYLNLLLDFYRPTLMKGDNRHYPMLVRWANGLAIESALSPEARTDVAYDPVEDLAQWLPEDYDKGNDVDRAQSVEATTLLPNYLLSSQGDRMSMAHSVEGRYPFLDLEVIDFAARLPETLKLRGLRDKFILRQSFAGIIPASIRSRPKVAYQAPEMMSFFSGGKLVDYAAEMLAPQSVKENGVFDSKAIQSLVAKGSRQQADVRMGFRENMTFLLALSTALLQRDFCSTYSREPTHHRAVRIKRVTIS